MFISKVIEFQCMSQERESTAVSREPTAIAGLTRRMVKAEEDAFREFYDLYSHRLYAYLFVICRGNEEQARELLQQTSIKVARYIRVFEDQEIFWKWLGVLARSCWVDENRKRNRYLAALERLWNWTAGSEPRWAPVVDHREIGHFLESLPEEDRALLTQKYLEGFSVREIAEECGSSEKTVESRLTRARNRLKEIISKRRQS
jgi:RNA polymerase sigma-70 factor (ECF subfamily)